MTWTSRLMRSILGLSAWLVLSCSLQGQAVLMPFPAQQFFDNNGKPCSSCLLNTYASGTNNALGTYTDYTGATLNTNPIVLNSAGYPSNGGTVSGIWLKASTPYRIQLMSALGSQIYQIDGVTGGSGNQGSQATTTVPYAATPVFTAIAQTQLFKMTLTGDVTSSTLLFSGVTAPSILIFELAQDNVGSHTFAWPTNVVGGKPLNPLPNTNTIQTFVWDGVNAVPPTYFSSGVQAVPFAPSLTFVPSSQNQVFTINLTGNVTTTNLDMSGVSAPSIVTWVLTQDNVGGRTWLWPTNTVGGAPINAGANIVTAQSFMWNGSNAIAIGPAEVGTPSSWSVGTLTAQGMSSPVYNSGSANPAGTGVIRFTAAEGIAWRNQANNNNLLLSKRSDDNLTYPNGLSLGGGTPLTTTNQTGTGSLVLDHNPLFTGWRCATVATTVSLVLGADDCFVTVTGLTGSINITIPTGQVGHYYFINRGDTSAFNVTLLPSSGNINGSTQQDVQPNVVVVCMSNGSNVWCTYPHDPVTDRLTQHTRLFSSNTTWSFQNPSEPYPPASAPERVGAATLVL
jgi:hypothetical protein